MLVMLAGLLALSLHAAVADRIELLREVHPRIRCRRPDRSHRRP
ncbi:hypothetical protein STRIP9103_05508 [Streptomyces ipomoeae 91-03]|uniref:Uncharacterized protein n=1 Tax=Streptomyces ipomoeae 91-03 TaxID=698759 RepID=L1KYI0_9ACTN|nr:hypothetical protein STRIP9103_05508 [Streptomyces ipomoeae 91-03]